MHNKSRDHNIQADFVGLEPAVCWAGRMDVEGYSEYLIKKGEIGSMEIKIPTSLNEAMVSIGELQEAVNWMQGQMNLLLSFVCSEPANRQKFALFAKGIVGAGLNAIDQEMQHVAQILLSNEDLRQYLPPSNSPPSSGDKPDPGHPGSSEFAHRSNVIQFPCPPKPPNI